MTDELPRLYGDLAPWWPLISAPADYAEEAEFYRTAMEAAARRPLREVLELGCGGGNNASHLKAHYELTLTDRSPAMLDVSRRLNPECAHVAGDMRDLRLGRDFDAVFVHDAVTYLTDRSQLAAVAATAWEHCRPGGVALLAPDFLRESFRPQTTAGGHDGAGGRAARYLEWLWDPDPGDTWVVGQFVYVLRAADGAMVTVDEAHRFGLFPRSDWLEAMAAAGFEATAIPLVHTELEPGSTDVFVGVRPA
jgi:SAM-dependent methyltransferase